MDVSFYIKNVSCSAILNIRKLFYALIVKNTVLCKIYKM